MEFYQDAMKNLSRLKNPCIDSGMGLERVVAWVCGLSHIRETIPFARTMTRLNP